ncbi:MAG: hypothetical protein LBE61_20570 [Burkholderiaceae bacterium]|jgi:hypothetical protein|nr:hypothetical protein [Burkholderiaceae bacterium]
MFRKLITVLPAVLLAGVAMAAELTPLDALRSRFPGGIPWKVEILDLNDNTLGHVELVITMTPARSCRFGDGVRVEYLKADPLLLPHAMGTYGVAKIDSDGILIDLIGGGVCDAYRLMGGVLWSDGSSTGEIYRYGRFGQLDYATYRASVP